ncbi:MAG: pentapeptide repeat-containing protein [Chloroflexi bacterium]|nr:pentapeptide repeat-containing protein [Chloroflexota bacterium]
MTIKEEESKKPLFQRIRETVSKKWENLSDKTRAIIGIIVIVLLGGIACSPILVFSSIDFFAAMPFIYKMLTFLVLSGLFLYYYFKWTFKYVSVLSKTLKTFYGWEDGIAVLLLVCGVYNFLMWPTVGFLVEFRAELIGAGIATLLIGNASQATQIQEEKKRLILQMGSPDHTIAIEAARQFRLQGWLQDGSLKGVFFVEANLSGADLGSANLSKTIFWGANLIGAKLEYSNLSRADLKWANLSGAELAAADLSGADLVDADLRGTILGSADLSGAKFCNEDLIGSARFDETTVWMGAFYKEGEKGTVFPEGFNPADHGMHLIHEGESYEEAYKRVFHVDWQ